MAVSKSAEGNLGLVETSQADQGIDLTRSPLIDAWPAGDAGRFVARIGSMAARTAA